jgi:uncharacterized membrane protein
MSVAFVVIGQILGLAVASGLNLYATIAVVGLASRLGWLPMLPPGLTGLENPLVIASAGLLYLIEFVLDKVPHVDSLWDTIHTFIRPTAAGLLAASALSGHGTELQFAIGFLAAGVALAAHGSKAGLRVALNARAEKSNCTVVSILEDAAAIGLAIAAIRFPAAAYAIAGAALLLLAVAGPRLWRVYRFGIRALAALLRGFFGASRWREAKEMSRSFRRKLPQPALGQGPARGVRGSLTAPGIGAYRNGWLVLTHAGPLFLYRSFLGPRCRTLDVAEASLRPGIWADTLELREADGRSARLLLLKDGPPAVVVLADLVPAPAEATR